MGSYFHPKKPASTCSPLVGFNLTTVNDFRMQHQVQINQPRSIARVLCGHRRNGVSLPDTAVALILAY